MWTRPLFALTLGLLGSGLALGQELGQENAAGGVPRVGTVQADFGPDEVPRNRRANGARARKPVATLPPARPADLDPALAFALGLPEPFPATPPDLTTPLDVAKAPDPSSAETDRETAFAIELPGPLLGLTEMAETDSGGPLAGGRPDAFATVIDLPASLAGLDGDVAVAIDPPGPLAGLETPARPVAAEPPSPPVSLALAAPDPPGPLGGLDGIAPAIRPGSAAVAAVRTSRPDRPAVAGAPRPESSAAAVAPGSRAGATPVAAAPVPRPGGPAVAAASASGAGSSPAAEVRPAPSGKFQSSLATPLPETHAPVLETHAPERPLDWTLRTTLETTGSIGTGPLLLSPPYEVEDGLTIVADSVRLRLARLDGPSTDAICANADNRMWACGLQARAALVNMIRSKPIVCQRVGGEADGPPEAECTLDRVDIGRILVRQGFARPVGPTERALAVDLRDAKAERRGLWNGGWTIKR
jgi:endonuclease YncB( thermonuclease family)